MLVDSGLARDVQRVMGVAGNSNLNLNYSVMA